MTKRKICKYALTELFRQFISEDLWDGLMFFRLIPGVKSWVMWVGIMGNTRDDKAWCEDKKRECKLPLGSGIRWAIPSNFGWTSLHFPIKEKKPVEAVKLVTYSRPVGLKEKRFDSSKNVRSFYAAGDLEDGQRRATDPVWFSDGLWYWENNCECRRATSLVSEGWFRAWFRSRRAFDCTRWNRVTSWRNSLICDYTEVVIKGRVLALNHNYNQINIFQIIMRKPAFYNE